MKHVRYPCSLSLTIMGLLMLLGHRPVAMRTPSSSSSSSSSSTPPTLPPSPCSFDPPPSACITRTPPSLPLTLPTVPRAAFASSSSSSCIFSPLVAQGQKIPQLTAPADQGQVEDPHQTAIRVPLSHLVTSPLCATAGSAEQEAPQTFVPSQGVIPLVPAGKQEDESNSVKKASSSSFAPTIQVITPSSPNYDKEREVRNAKINAYPDAIYLCKTAADVQDALAFAREHKKQVCIRSGRHSYEGFSVANGAVVVDVSQMKTLELSSDKTSVLLGAGLSLTEIYEELWKHGLTIPGGSCPSVGIAGLTLGGGVGFGARQMGLTCDSVMELEMIDAAGNLLNVRPDNDYADLFWACCGAGAGNLGVALSFTFRTHPVKKVSTYVLTWDWTNVDNMEKISQAWAQILNDAPAELMMFLRFTKRPPVHQPANAVSSLLPIQTLSSFGQFFGPPETLRSILAPLLKLQPKAIDISEKSYIEAVHQWEGTLLSRMPFSGSSLYLIEPLRHQALALIDASFSHPHITNAFVVLDSYGGMMRNFAYRRRSAFAHRDKLASIQIWTRWNDDTQRASHEEWVEKLRANLAAIAGEQGAYVNYPNMALKDPLTLYYGSNYKRLQIIKEKYDPHAVFYYSQSIPPAATGELPAFSEAGGMK